MAEYRVLVEDNRVVSVCVDAAYPAEAQYKATDLVAAGEGELDTREIVPIQAEIIK